MTMRNFLFYVTKYRFTKYENHSIFQLHNRYFSNAECRARRSELFSLEKKRQKDNVGRIEKIEVRYLGVPEDVTLVMNKGLSTPFDCFRHLSQNHIKKAALALVDGHEPWDLHRPLEDSCTLQLLHFTVAEPQIVNRAFWRTCSFLLGATIQNAFKDELPVLLHSFPGPNVKSGSFVHDIELGTKDWTPTSKEMYSLSAEMVKLCSKDLRIERLEVKSDLASEMFRDNNHKLQHIPAIAAENNGQIIMYRVGDHVDISRGPMVGSTGQIGRLTITAVHPLKSNSENGNHIYRFQGVALPRGIIINHFAYSILENRAKQLNPARLPNEPFITEDKSILKSVSV